MRAELLKLGEVVVVAPATEQSAAGHSVTVTSPLIVQEVLDDSGQWMGWAVEGRPADCVRLALRELLPSRPDLIVSGLNSGSNAGINVLYSGTVAAAIEGAFFRITSIACSLEVTQARPANFAAGAAQAIRVVEQIVASEAPVGSLFNVNVPDLERGPVRGIRVVPQNLAAYEETFDRRKDPRGRLYFWTGASFHCPDPHPDSDVTTLAEGFITVTPLQFNLTNAGLLRDMTSWKW
jgi:5'-nucleotidase